MLNQRFKTPIAKTAYILGSAVLLIVGMGLSGSACPMASAAQLILFVLGLAVGLMLTIAVMIGIFFTAVAMTDKDIAIELWNNLKNSGSCCC